MWADTSDTPHKGAPHLSHTEILTNHVPCRTKCHLWGCLWKPKTPQGNPALVRTPYCLPSAQFFPSHCTGHRVFLIFVDKSLACKMLLCASPTAKFCCLPALQLLSYMEHPNTPTCSQDSAMYRYYQVCVFTYVKAHLQVSTIWNSSSRLGVFLKKFQIQDMQCNFLFWAALTDKCKVSNIVSKHMWQYIDGKVELS